jgi:N6-L-threonylcarbamoyladenine synthase
MALVLGIETSCDETGVGIFDSDKNEILLDLVFSQVKLHEIYGGVVPEIASRSQLEKIDVLVTQALDQAYIKFNEIDVVAATAGPGLIGSLLVGLCFAKAIAWSGNKKLIGINHLEGHIFSSFIKNDFSCSKDIPFPHICLAVSGGHTSLYLVSDFGSYTTISQTVDDAAGEAFDKTAKILGFGYPGGAIIEQLAEQVNFVDCFDYPRTKNKNGEILFSFSGLKTAVLYHLVKKGIYNIQKGLIIKEIPLELKQQIASSMLVCVADIFEKNLKIAIKNHENVKAITFVGGVACNQYIKNRLQVFCKKKGVQFFHPPKKFCTDNGGMISFVGGYKANQGIYSDFDIDVFR